MCQLLLMRRNQNNNNNNNNVPPHPLATESSSTTRTSSSFLDFVRIATGAHHVALDAFTNNRHIRIDGEILPEPTTIKEIDCTDTATSTNNGVFMSDISFSPETTVSTPLPLSTINDTEPKTVRDKIKQAE